MSRRTYLSFGRAIICLVILLTSTAKVGLAQRPTSEEWALGYHAFNLLLQESDVKICKLSEWINTPADEKFVILINQSNTDWLPIRRTTPALVMHSNGRVLNVQFRPMFGSVALSQTEDFFSSEECPIVRPRSTEEVFFGVHEIICNVPGFISSRSVEQNVDEQLYPPMISPFRRNNDLAQRRFSVITTDPTRRIYVADPQLLTNQMIFKGDNLRFADNTVRWLSNDYRRKNVLLLINGSVQNPVDPNDLDILTPIPSHGEVIELISKLPAKEIAQVANSVLQMSEDENILNDIAHNYIDDLADGQINRIILFVILACCCVMGLVTYFWQRRVLRRTASVTESRRKRNLSRRETGSGASERQAAASMLLNSFCLDVANRRLADWPEFPTPIVSQHQTGPAVKATHEMADAFWRLRTKSKTYWTKQNLAKLEEATEEWRHLISNNQIVMHTES